MLPTYTRTSGTGNVQMSSKLLTTTRKALRTREKFLILLLFATLVFVCLGGFHISVDRGRLNAKIQNEWVDDGHLEKLKLDNADVKPVQSPTTQSVDQPLFGIQDDNVFRPNGEDKDPIARERREKVKEVSLLRRHIACKIL